MTTMTRSPVLTTPVGVAIWPKLNEPDRKFKEEGEYSVWLRLTREDAAPVIKVMNDELKAGHARHAKELGKPKLKVHPLSIREVEGDPDCVDIKFSTPASGTSRKTGRKWERRVALFDSRGKPLGDDAPRIGGGSRIKVAAEVYCWFTPSLGVGISLRPQGVQVIELVEGGMSARTADAFGFTSEETGFVAGGEGFEFTDDSSPQPSKPAPKPKKPSTDVSADEF